MRVDPVPSALSRANAAPSPSPAPERGDPIPRSVPNRDAVREGLDAAHHAGPRGVAAIRGAASSYHAGTIGNRESPNTRWPDATLHYDDSLVRHDEQMRAEGHR